MQGAQFAPKSCDVRVSIAEMFRQIDAAKTLGLEDRDIADVLKFQHVSKKDISYLLNGEIPEWVPSTQSEARAIKRIYSFLDPEDREERINAIRERYNLIQAKAVELRGITKE